MGWTPVISAASLACALCLTAPLRAQGGSAPPKAHGGEMSKQLGEGPVDFRCDRMQIFSKPNRTLCLDNVVVRRASLLVCCERMESFADDQWNLERVVCNADVRAHRGEDLVYADRAELWLARSDLVLTGTPKVRRGQSVLHGERVTIDLNTDRARVARPKAHYTKPDGAQPALPAWPLTGELPAKCPLPEWK